MNVHINCLKNSIHNWDNHYCFNNMNYTQPYIVEIACLYLYDICCATVLQWSYNFTFKIAIMESAG